jgi:hypothetical protein
MPIPEPAQGQAIWAPGTQAVLLPCPQAVKATTRPTLASAKQATTRARRENMGATS